MRIPNGVAWRLLFPHECIDCDGEIATPMMHESQADRPLQFAQPGLIIRREANQSHRDY